ncbi:uncharacterized protein METZ01_LOCUS292120 [marine metagenome]|uniref:Uncharacterized protein n=1 Tax=marine metagenome TaxID=408172 RepID=A0A382LRT8_9ZZZZ
MIIEPLADKRQIRSQQNIGLKPAGHKVEVQDMDDTSLPVDNNSS